MVHASESWHAYRVAGIEIAADRPLSALEPFRHAADSPAILIAGPSGRRWVEPTEVRQARGFLAGRERAVRATWHGSSVVDLDCEGEVVRWQSGSHEGSPNSPQRLSGSGDSELALELLLGPALLLALSRARRLTLHASAARAAGRTLVLAGESGRGKSTLAAGFGDDALADDLALIDSGTLELTPRFPQRKWREAQQTQLPERTGGVTVIELRGDSELRSARLERLSAAGAARCWLAHTVPARLFSAAWSRRLLAQAADAALAAEAYRLHLPWRPEAVEEQTAGAVDLLRRTFGAEPSA